jgi:aspartate aminotransferase
MDDLKSAMVDYFSNYGIQIENEDIVVATGGSEAISFAFNVIADPGDEVIIPEPFYTNYNGFATQAGLKIVPVTTDPENGYHLPSIETIEARISSKTRAILINSPNNPTGTVFSEEEIRSLAVLAKKHDLFLVADEVYKEFTYDGETHYSVLQLEDLEDHVIVVDSISKRYSSCGARIGAFISRNQQLVQAVLKFAQARLCPPTLEQMGAIGAYRMPFNYFDPIISEYQSRRDLLFEILTSNSNIMLKRPKGAFYFMAGLPVDDAESFARWMLSDFQVGNHTVMVAPGAGFYSTPGRGKNEVRIAYVLEKPKLEKAGQILLSAIDRYNG